MAITRFEDIEAWQAARELCRAVVEVISNGEFAKSYALKDQIDRASGSVMDNIAEGFDGGRTQSSFVFLAMPSDPVRRSRVCCIVPWNAS